MPFARLSLAVPFARLLLAVPLARLLLAVALVLPAPAQGVDYASLDPARLVTLVTRDRDATDPALFTALGDREDRRGLDALERCASLVYRVETLDLIFEQVARCRGADELGVRAREILRARAFGETVVAQRPATRALVAIGSNAVLELRAIAREHGDETCRSLAVGGLLPFLRSTLDAEGLELLLASFHAPLSGSREAGVRTLAAFRDEAARKRLAKAVHDRDLAPATRAMVAEALAAQGGDEARAVLVEAALDRHLGVRLAALRGLRRCGTDADVPTVERAMRAREAAVRRAALVTLGTLAGDAPGWHDRLRELARDRDVALRLGAIDLLRGLDDADERDLSLLSDLAADEDALVRRTAVGALGERRDVRVVPVLLERLEGDTLRVREAARAALVSVTGEDLGTGPVRWRRWWKAEGERWKPPSPEEVAARIALRAERREDDPTEARFFGLSLRSDRVAFVIDTSGSMETRVSAGHTRLQAVAQELEATLQGFPAGGRFNLLFFSDHVRRWRKGLVERDADTLRDAVVFCRAQRPVGGTAIHTGLVEAFEDTDVDTIVLLTDGDPTEGRLTDPRAILADVEERNELRQVVVHCVAVGGDSDLLRELAEATGGEYRSVY